MQVSQQTLNRSVQDFLDSSAATELFDEHSSPRWMSLMLTFVMLGVGLLLIASILGAWKGIKLIQMALQGKAFQGESGEKFARRKSEVRGLIGHLIMAGPAMGHRGERAALILGAFEEVPHDHLRKLAQFCGRLYSGEIEDPRHDELHDLLLDDTYRPDRRRVVPKPYRKGYRLYLFDLRIQRAETREIDDARVTGLLALPGSDGAAIQLPWDIVSPAILQQ